MENKNKNYNDVKMNPEVYPTTISNPGNDRAKRERILSNFIEVSLTQPDAFRKIKETLTRMGVGSYKEKVVKQSCHILHKKGRYYIVHFKELKALDGETVNFSVQDYLRRNQIAIALENWGLCRIENEEVLDEIDDVYCHVIIIPFRDKDQWQLFSSYEVGAWTKELAESE